MTQPNPVPTAAQPEPLWWDVATVAQMLKLSKQTVRKYNKELGGVLVCGALRYDPAKVKIWVAWKLKHDEGD